MICHQKRTLELIQKDDANDDDDDEGPKKKKAKTASSISEKDRAMAEVYEQICVKSNDELKDILRWNHQILGGKKADMLTRVIDGKLNGRLGRCPTCLRGRVKLQTEDGGHTVYCNGYFDEDINARVSCFYKAPVADAPRMHPFFTEEPNEEENEEMDAQWESSKLGSSDAAKAQTKASSEVNLLVKGIQWVSDTYFFPIHVLLPHYYRVLLLKWRVTACVIIHVFISRFHSPSH